MNTIRSLIAALALAATAFAGCAMEAAPTGERTGKAVSFSSNTPERVTGTYRREGTTLYFESERYNGASVVTLNALDGTELLRVTSGVERTVHAVDDLKARPELALVDELPEVLAEAGVDEALIAPVIAAKAIDLVGAAAP